MKKVILLLVISILFASFASARIILTEPNDNYNLGDRLYISLTTLPSFVSGNFEINLICKSTSINLYRIPAEPSFSVGVEQKITTFVTLTPILMSSNLGNCNIIASMGDEQTSSKTFIISDAINVQAKLDKQNYNPGERITYNLTAIKANNQPLDGFLEVSGAQSFSRAVSKGQSIDSFTMPPNADSGDYVLTFSVYDRGINNSIMNKGNHTTSFKINQVPTSILADSPETATPGSSFNFTLDLFDQAGKNMTDKLDVEVYSSDSKTKKTLTLNSGTSNSIDFETNATAGKWTLYASLGKITTQKEFTMQEVSMIDMAVLDSGELLVKNIGNTLYNQSINVTIGNSTQEVSLNLQIGESKTFYLKAPDGEYTVKVGDQEKRLLLTGNAIAVDDSGQGILSKYSFISYFLIAILLAGGVIFTMRKVSKRTVYTEDPYPATKISTFSQKTSTPEVKSEPAKVKIVPNTSRPMIMPGSNVNSGKFMDVRKSNVGDAEGSLVLKGQKVNSSIIVIKLNTRFGGAAKQQLEKIMTMARERKAVVDWRDNHIIIILSPLITRVMESEPAAARLGLDILNELNDYNRKFNDKIGFGVGLNSGDLISAIEDGKLKYTSIGNTILLTKRIADIANGRLLISDNMRNKIARDIRGEKTGEIGGIAVWSIVSLQDREANKAKLDDLLKRMGH